MRRIGQSGTNPAPQAQRAGSWLRGVVVLTLWVGGLSLSAQNTVVRPPDDPVPEVETQVTSERMRMRTEADRNVFFFEDNVVIRGTNLRVTCDYLEVLSRREQADADATIGRVSAIESLLAVGNVVIVQAGREARCGRAVFVPAEGKIILTDQPVIYDGETRVAGTRIIIERGVANPFVVENPSLTLESLPDLGYDLDAAEGADEGADSANPAAEGLEEASPEAEELSPRESRRRQRERRS